MKYLISQYDIHSKLPEFRLQLKYLKLGHRVGTVQLLWPFVFALYVLQKLEQTPGSIVNIILKYSIFHRTKHSKTFSI